MSQTVYFNNPQTIVDNTNDINAIKSGLTTTLNTQNINSTGTFVLNNSSAITTLTDLRKQIDQALINAELMYRPVDFRVIPRINPDSTMWFTPSPTWTITSGYTGTSSSGAVAIQYNTDMNLVWQGRNNNGSTCFFTGTFYIPSLNTGSVSFNIWSSGATATLLYTGSTGAQYGPMQYVNFKYKGQGQNADTPIQQATQMIAVILPPTWFSTGTHNLIIGHNGGGETNAKNLEVQYTFPLYGSYTGMKDNRMYGQQSNSVTYLLNTNLSSTNQGNYVCLSIPSDNTDSGINPFEESGEFDSFLKEWLIAVGKKTINKTYFHGLSQGGGWQFGGQPAENYYWQGLRFNYDSVAFVASPLATRVRGTIENSVNRDLYNIFPVPNPQTWCPNMQKTSYLNIVGLNDTFMGAPFVSIIPTTIGNDTVYNRSYYYTVDTTARFLRDKFQMNENVISTGACFSNTGIYAGLTSITGSYGGQTGPYKRLYSFQNPLKYGGESSIAPVGFNTDPYITNINVAPNYVYFPNNPCNVFSIVVPKVGHALLSNWSDIPDTDPEYGLDFMKVWIDFVNKTL